MSLLVAAGAVGGTREKVPRLHRGVLSASSSRKPVRLNINTWLEAKSGPSIRTVGPTGPLGLHHGGSAPWGPRRASSPRVPQACYQWAAGPALGAVPPLC